MIFYRLKITFIDKEGESHTFEVAKGDNLLDIAQANELEMEGTFHNTAQICAEINLITNRCLWRLMCLLNLPCYR
jgi:hypothetical protein